VPAGAVRSIPVAVETAQVAAVLAAGADGAVLGTRLCATPESTLSDAKKVRMH